MSDCAPSSFIQILEFDGLPGPLGSRATASNVVMVLGFRVLFLFIIVISALSICVTYYITGNKFVFIIFFSFAPS